MPWGAFEEHTLDMCEVPWLLTCNPKAHVKRTTKRTPAKY
jgi:hypothetical protein